MIFYGCLSSPYPLLGYLEFFAPVFTAVYAFWFVIRLSFDPVPSDLVFHRSPMTMRGSFLFLAALALVVGLYPSPIYQWVERAASMLALGSR